MSEVEHDWVVQRTRSGLAAARARGRVGGRPRVLTPEQVGMARREVEHGRTEAEVAKTLGVRRSTLVDALSREAASA